MYYVNISFSMVKDIKCFSHRFLWASFSNFYPVTVQKVTPVNPTDAMLVSQGYRTSMSVFVETAANPTKIVHMNVSQTYMHFSIADIA